MKKNKHLIHFFLLVIFILLILFYRIDLALIENTSIYTGMATFLFAIFISYFITRQNTRFSKMRQQIAINDGNFSNVFRVIGNFGKKPQVKAGEIISNHYKKIIDNHNWVYNIENKSTTITDLNNLVAKEGSGTKLTSAQNFSIRQSFQSLANLQVSRKVIWSLYRERITLGQWSLVVFLTFVLLVTIGIIPNTVFLIYVLKIFFGSIIVLTIFLLYKIDNFLLFKDSYGLKSSSDVLDLVKGKK